MGSHPETVLVGCNPARFANMKVDAQPNESHPMMSPASEAWSGDVR